MAPQIGPNEAPMMPKTPPRLPATLVTARMMLTIAPMPTDRNGFTLGRTVLKLLAAMNEEKQAPGKAARVRPIMIQGYASVASSPTRLSFDRLCHSESQAR